MAKKTDSKLATGKHSGRVKRRSLLKQANDKNESGKKESSKKDSRGFVVNLGRMFSRARATASRLGKVVTGEGASAILAKLGKVIKFALKFGGIKLLLRGGKGRARLAKNARKLVARIYALFRQHIYAPFLHPFLCAIIGVIKGLQARLKKRYGKTAFYKAAARNLAQAQQGFRNLPRPARLAAYVSAAFVLWMLSGSLPGFSGSATRAPLEIGPPSVRVYESFEQDYLPYLELSGQTQASRQVVVRAETSGRVEGTFFQRGEYVEAGDELVGIDPATRPLELEEARTQLQQAEIEFNAIGSLARGGYRSELRRLQALSDLNSARVREDRISRDLANTRPLAPFSGSIAALKVERGDFLSVGNEIALLLDLDPLKVRVAVSERDIASVHLGARVSGELVIGESFSGKIGTIAPASSSSTRTFEVEILIANRDGRWREGLTAQVRLPIGQRKAHLIPASLLSLDSDGRIGVKVIEEDVVRFRKVDLIGENEDGVWVRGLGDSSLIISVGHETVSTGMTVESVIDERFSSQSQAPSQAPSSAEEDSAS